MGIYYNGLQVPDNGANSATPEGSHFQKVLQEAGYNSPPLYLRVSDGPIGPGKILGNGFMALLPDATATDASSTPPAGSIATYDTQPAAVPSSPQWGTVVSLGSLTSPQTGGSTLKARAVIIIGFLLLLASAFGQSDRSIHVKEFQGITVGAKVGNAMQTCPVGSSPCILILDASLAAYPAGTMPALCSNCFLLDYRSGTGQFSGTRKLVDTYPTTCSTTNGAFTSQLQCAAAMEIDKIKSGAQTANVILEAGDTTYGVCGSVLLADPSFSTRYSISIVGNAFQGTTIMETCSSANPVLYLPLVAGAYPNQLKQLSLTHLFVNAAKLAPYAIGIYGGHYNSTFQDLHYRNGTTGDAVWGVDGNNDGWGFEDTFADLRSEYDWSGGSGASATCTVSGGVPTCTVNSGGANYTASAQVWLTGYQGGASNVPCSSMGTTTGTFASGVLTAITTTATGCSGTVYAQVFDGAPIDYATDLENETDSRLIYGIVDTVGRLAGLRLKHGNNRVLGHHGETYGQFGIEIDAPAVIFGENCGEEQQGCFNLHGHTAIYGTIYSSSLTTKAYALINNAWGTQTFDSVFCGTTDANEYHTFASASGTADTSNDSPLGNNSLRNVSYCGAGTGSTINYDQTRTIQNVTATSATTTTTTAQTVYMDAAAPSMFWRFNGTSLWQTLLTGANGDYRILDVFNGNTQRLDFAQSGYTYLSSYGTAPVQINATANSSTGGLSVWSGGATPAFVAGIDGTGQVKGKTAVFTAGTPTVSAGQIGMGTSTVAASSCGSLTGAAGCLVINVGGTTRYEPYW